MGDDYKLQNLNYKPRWQHNAILELYFANLQLRIIFW